ncbi:MAG: hypothetical protein AAGE85_04185 [Pseudomonadota bacterium]
MSKVVGGLICLIVASILAGCGSKTEFVRSCDEERRYEQAQAHDPLSVPEDLDEPDPLKAMPLPEAAPGAERPPGSPCLELPPGVNVDTAEQDEEE